MLAMTHEAPQRGAGVKVWVLQLSRPGRAWSTSRIDNVTDAETVIRGMELRERAEGTRLRVELARADGTTVTAADRVFRYGRWVDAGEQAS